MNTKLSPFPKTVDTTLKLTNHKPLFGEVNTPRIGRGCKIYFQEAQLSLRCQAQLQVPIPGP